MRLLFLNHNTVGRGGTFFRAFEVARHMVRRGHAVTLVTISLDSRWGFHAEDREGVRVVHSPDLFWGIGRTGWDPWDTARRIGYVRREPWDLIHAWDSRPVVSLPALYAKRFARGKSGWRPLLVMDWCDWWGRGGTQAERSRPWLRAVAPVETLFEESFRRFADGTTVISHALRRRAIDLGIDESTIRVMPHGCPPVSGAVSFEERTKARRQLGIADGTKLVISVGALNRSDAALLFETLKVLLSQNDDVRFALIGKHGVEIPADVRQHTGFTETGFVDDGTLAAYAAASDVLLTVLADTVASRARWPSKINPFLSAAKPVVVTHVGDLAGMLDDARAAVVTDATPDAIATGVLRVLNDPELASATARRGYEIAQGPLSWQSLVEQLDGFYTHLQEQRECHQISGRASA